jgi:hypothetical protein
MKVPVLPTRPSEEDILISAVEMTCAALIEVYKIDDVKLALLVDVIARAILEKFRNGERNGLLLARHATLMALQSLGTKHH